MDYIKVLFSTLVLLLLVLCSFFVSYYSSMSVFDMLDIPEIKESAYVISWFSGSFASVIPLAFFFFYGITFRLMMKSVFDINISFVENFFAVSTGFIPLLLYQYFFWYNLIMYSPATFTGLVENYFKEIKFLFDFTYKEMLAIGDMCFMLFFPVTILTLYQSCKQNLFKIIVAVCVPSLIMALCCSII